MESNFARTTRSGRTFASWNSAAVIPNPDFDIASLVQRAVALEQQAQPPDDLLAHMDPEPSDYRAAAMMDAHSTSAPSSSSTSAPSPSRPNPRPRHSPVPSPPSLPASMSRTERSKLQWRQIRKKRREAEKAKMKKFGGAAPRPKATEKYAQMAEPVATPNTTKRARHAETGYTGLPDPKKEQARRTHGLEELTGEDYGFEVRQWDGRTPLPIVDRTGTIIGMAIGQPEDDGWEDLHQHVAGCLKHARQRCNPVLSKDDMRRGEFWTCQCGVSHGGGQTRPMNFSNTKAMEELLESLNSQPCFQRLASFTSSAFASWAPSLHKHYCEELGKLQDHDPSLRRPFDSSVFMATTYNLGPQTVCFRHLDSANLAYGWCAITALGSFDPTKGGHLVLWECKLIIEFPPGSTILIPSALIHHSNTPIAEGETRYSFTQYASGGLFRWVDHNFQTVEAHRASLSAQALTELDEWHSRRWSMGLAKLPRMPWVPGPDV
ncbi:hypothetical protein NLJ89_g8432 [Agrocybe chaxingu]|uniref:Uncharacterized protein n=1 Tax=Agrocybe chaxingu TaxID=84603 RepID=A0A9W8JSM5_9AGAR|nr:hypothetical protein NLJ89_g8432 [Agrocybe chaxingu]